MTKARTNASVAPAVGRNIIINGAMNVAQRATSATGIGGNGYFTLDRWKIEAANTAGRLTMTQTADGPNGISANCIKLDCTTADTSIAAAENFLLEQRIEGQNLQRVGKGVAGAKQITVSFYTKANAAFDFVVELYDADNSRQISKLFSTTTDWVRQEITFPADVDDGSSPFGDDNAASLFLNFWLHAGATFTGGTLNTSSWANITNANRAAGIDSFFSSTDNNFFLTGVQMEVGPVATEFEQEDISTTLAKCQRYYYKTGPIISNDAFCLGFNGSATVSVGVTHFPVTMRADPTALEQNGTAAHYKIAHASTTTTCSAVPAFDRATIDSGSVLFTVGSGLTTGQAAELRSLNNTAFLAWEAEI